MDFEIMILVLTFLCIPGFIWGSHRWLKIDIPSAPLFSLSLLGILLFLSAAADWLENGTRFLIYAGFGLTILSAVDILKNKNNPDVFSSLRIAAVFLVMVLMSYLITIGMTFTIIDDYVYWGILGKYLFLFSHLPDSDTTIIARHLSYTPGAGVWHYFFYTLAGRYSIAISYYSQNLMLISTLFAVIRQEEIKKSLILIGLLIIFMTLFSGSIFTKLQTDYLLSAYFFAIIWVYFKKGPDLKTVISISAPLIFLFLLKEIGLILNFSILVFLLVDLMFSEQQDKAEKNQLFLSVFMIAVFSVLIKIIWTRHCQEAGFSNFSSAVNLNTIRNSFQIFSDEYVRNGFLIFIKDLFLGPADRLNLPYLLWYGILFFMWKKIAGYSENKKKAAFKRFIKVASASFVIYLILIYFLQIIVFHVGRSSGHSIGMTRYLNIYFAQIVYISLLYYLYLFFFRKGVSGRKLYMFMGIAVLVIGISRIETELNREEHFKAAENIAVRIERNLPAEKANAICVIPGTNDHHLWIKLLYYLLPNKIHHGPVPMDSKENFLSALSKYDFVFFYNVSDNVLKWLRPFAKEMIEKESFFKVMQEGSIQQDDAAIRSIKLERLF